MRLPFLILVMVLGGAVSPVAACVGGFAHQWRDLPLAGSSLPQIFTAENLLRFLEARMGGASGTWGAAMVSEARARRWNPCEVEKPVAGESSTIRWKWLGILPPFGTGPLAQKVPDGLAGLVWIDPIEIHDEPIVKIDSTFPGAMALRIGWISCGIFRVMACRSDGEILLIDELRLLSTVELDSLFPCAFPLGGLWVRRCSWQGPGNDRAVEAMFLPPFGFGKPMGGSVSGMVSGAHE